MYGAVRLTHAQFDALWRLNASLDIPDTSISDVQIGTLMINRMGVGEWYITVTFSSGHGNRVFHVDKEGNSARADTTGNSTLVS